MPGPLDIDDAIDVDFADFTNFDVQRFQEQSPRPSCGRTRALAVRCWAWKPILQLLRPGRDPWNGCSTLGIPGSMNDSDMLRLRKKPAASEAKRLTIGRVLTRPAPDLQQDYLRDDLHPDGDRVRRRCRLAARRS